MNILYHHRTQGKGVEGVHIRGMVEGFRELGHKVVVVSPPGVDPFSDINSEKIGACKGKGLGKAWKWFGRNLPEVIFEMMELGYNFWAYFKIKNIVKKERFDFIYERYALNTFSGLDISKKFNIPLVIEVNDATFIERVRPLKMKRNAGRIEMKIFQGADLIVTISSYFKNIIVEKGVRPQKVIVLSNAIDENNFKFSKGRGQAIRKRFFLDGKVVIGYVGAFVYWHGVDILMRAFKGLVKSYKDIRLLLVGDGVTFESAKKFVKDNDLEDFVILAGKVSHNEVPSYIDAMDICVIPDSNEYGSPMKLFEYMAMAKPVVAPKLLPLEDVIECQKNGILFEPKKEKALSEALEALIRDPDKAQALGQMARKKALEKHTWLENARIVAAKLALPL